MFVLVIGSFRFCHLNYYWSQRTDLNRRPIPYEGIALPTELRWHILLNFNAYVFKLLGAANARFKLSAASGNEAMWDRSPHCFYTALPTSPYLRDMSRSLLAVNDIFCSSIRKYATTLYVIVK